MTDAKVSEGTLFGHPTGLFTLFFAEMWERFSFYGMRALLIFYMTKSFLGYGDGEAYAIYGAYTALVYMTPFLGGMLADRLLGQRRAVVLGGLLMAAGHLAMAMPTELSFFFALALLIVGNGFFKPNISTLVGSLYPAGSPRRDGGFTIFYMGINLGAAISPLLCGYIGENYGWHKGFGLATAGMLTGLAVFVVPVRATQFLIMAAAIATSCMLFVFRPDNLFSIAVNVFIGICLLAAGIIAWKALSRGGLPREVGQPPNAEALRRPVLGFLNAEWATYMGALVSVPIFALLVSGFSPFTHDNQAIQLVSKEFIQELETSGSGLQEFLATVVKEASKPAGLLLILAGCLSLVYLLRETFRLDKVRRERMFVVLVLTFFSLLFWSFFEQAGSSINNFTDRNVDRVFATRTIAESEVGSTIRLVPTQEQLGYSNGTERFTMNVLTDLQKEHETAQFEIDWIVAADNVGMGIAGRQDEIPASTFQSVNAVFILIFGLILTTLWSFLAARRIEPSTPLKFALGLIQLALGFGALWYGAQHCDSRGMVGLEWLFLGYLLHTTGELCLSPVGLAMVTRLTPLRLVSTLMGTWFLATAFSQYLAGIISQFTGVSEGGDSGSAVIPSPIDSVHVYGDVFYKIMIAGLVCGAICLVLVPLIKRWQHEGVVVEDE